MLELKPKPRSMMEGPWRKYWPCLLPWIAMQVVMSISWLHTVGYGRSSIVPFRLEQVSEISYAVVSAALLHKAAL